MQNIKTDLDNLIHKLIRSHGMVKVIEAIISACDAFADFSHSCNDKKTEAYWREVAVNIFDIKKCISNIIKPTKKF